MALNVKIVGEVAHTRTDIIHFISIKVVES